MPTVQLRYVGALTHVDVPILRREGEPLDEHGDGCLVRGEVFICDAKTAGRAPTYDDDGNVTDYGEGLLAQPSNFEYADKPPAEKKPAKRPRKAAGKRPRKAAAAKPDPSPPSTPTVATSDDTQTEV